MLRRECGRISAPVWNRAACSKDMRGTGQFATVVGRMVNLLLQANGTRQCRCCGPTSELSSQPNDRQQHDSDTPSRWLTRPHLDRNWVDSWYRHVDGDCSTDIQACQSIALSQEVWRYTRTVGLHNYRASYRSWYFRETLQKFVLSF